MGWVARGVSTGIARGVALRLVSGVFGEAFPNLGSPLGRVSLSVGLAGATVDADACDSNAEEALEQSIMSGGHQVRLYGEQIL